MPPLLSQEQASQLLEPFHGPLLMRPYEAATEQWRAFVTTMPEAAVGLDATTRANMVHCWARKAARGALLDLPDVREFSALGFFAMAIAETVLIRFKYTGSGAPSNVATGQQKRLARNQYDGETMTALKAEGMVWPPSLLTCGYSLSHEMELGRVEVRLDHNGSLLWRYLITDDKRGGYGTGGVVEPTPFPNMPAPTAAVVRSTKREAEKAHQASRDETQGADGE